jgi:4'-phosphopantetheinyl transferase
MTIPATADAPQVLWPDAPGRLHLHDREIHLFCMSFEQPPTRVRELEDLLSRAERERADRFHFENDRRRFVVSHGGLREILGELLQVPARRLEFSCGPHGKPHLAGMLNEPGLRFNLAHAGSLAVYAVALRQEVGVDVEQFRRVDGADTFAGRFFSKRELEEWNAVPRDLRMEAFFNYWTRKEACLKATGQGICDCLSQIEVSLFPGTPARVISETGPAERLGRWCLQSLVPAVGYVGAVAAELRGFDLRIQQWRWPGQRAAFGF